MSKNANHNWTRKGILIVLFIICSLQSTSALDIPSGTYFQTTEVKAQYYTAANFTLNNVTVYPTALSFNGGNITTNATNQSAWINIILQNLDNKTDYSEGVIYFTSDGEANYINVTDNFANFTITNGKTYGIYNQSTYILYQTSTASSSEIKFSSIPAGSWLISTPRIHGLVLSYPSYDPIEGATVNIWNSTGWSNSTTTSEMGYYSFKDLTWDYTTVTGETFNSSVYDTWQSLAHENIINSSDVVYNTSNIINETFNTSIYDTWQSLNHQNIHTDSETVYNYTAIINETFNSSVYDSSVSLNHSSIVIGTVLVTNITDENPFILNSDYTMNYSVGNITVLSTGNMSNYTDYHIDYNYTITFIKDTDYAMNYTDGKINTDSGGSMLNDTYYYIDYNYTGYFIKDTDYAMNYTDGKIQVKSIGNMTNHTLYCIDYNYTGPTSIYFLNASAPNHNTSSDAEIIISINGYTRQDFILAHYFTIIVKDFDTHAKIEICTGTWQDTELNTTNGTMIFTMNLTSADVIEISAKHYYPGDAYAYYDFSTGTFPVYNTTVYLALITQIQFPPHIVEFRVRDVFGNYYEGVNVTAQGYETTSPQWDWLYSLIGYTKGTPIENTSMTGFTDSMGRISFLMIEVVKYDITFVKASPVVNESMFIYPKESQYIIIITPTWSPTREDDITWNLSTARHNATYVNLSLNYTDSLNETSELWFYVKYKNGTEIFSQSFTNNSTVVVNYTIYEDPWEERIWGFNATQETFGALRQDKIITFRDGLRIDLNLTNENYYTWFSIASLILLGTLFSVTVAKFGYVVLPFISMLFWYIGWLALNFTILTTVLMLGILLFMGKTEKDKGL